MPARAQRKLNIAVNSVGGRIRQARLEAGLSLAAVSQKDFSRAFLNQVELGRSRPSPRTLRLIAERLRRPVDYFLQDEPEHRLAAHTEYVLMEAETALLKDEPGAVIKLLDRQTVDSMPLPARMSAMLFRGEAFTHQRQGVDALEALAGPVEYFGRSGPVSRFVRALDALGGAYWASHRMDEALSTFKRAHQVYEDNRLEEPDLLARIMGHIAVIHQQAGRHDEAVGSLEAGLAATERLLDLPRRALMYEGLAISYYEAGNTFAALEYAHKALRIFEQLHHLRKAAQLQHNTAEMLGGVGRPAEAERLYRKAIDTATDAEAPHLIPLSRAALAELALKRGAVDEAIQLAADAIAESQRLNLPGPLAATLRITARIAHARKDWAASDAAFERAIAAYEASGRFEYLAVAHSEFAACLRERGEVARAADHFEQAYRIRTSGGRLERSEKAGEQT